MSENRIAYLDAARTFAALMGIVLHAACGYMKFAIAEWPRYGAEYNIFFDYLVGIIHLIYMPAYFFLAGFFCHLLNKKLKFLGFTVNRLKRIVLPLLIFSTLIHLRLLISSLFLNQIHSLKDLLLIYNNVSYLWFLEYLLIYYIFYLLIMPLMSRATISRLFDAPTSYWINSRWSFITIVGLQALLLYLSNAWYIPVILSIIPGFYLLLMYAIYFLLGVLVMQYNVFEKFFRVQLKYCVSGFIVFGLYFIIMQTKSDSEIIRSIAIVLYSFSGYLLLLSFFGGCVKFFPLKNRLIRYCADASYWMYLSQIYFILIVHDITARFLNSIFAQFLVIFVVTTLLTLITYPVFFRRPSQLRASFPLTSVSVGKGN
ncbi:MAG: acyltransferase family protein [Gammaproteobacteria bacterium]|nr:acyltransferase family protein [Gammaproteobacteria bacterium]